MIAACVAMRNRSGMAGPRSGRAENQCVASSPAAAVQQHALESAARWQVGPGRRRHRRDLLDVAHDDPPGEERVQMLEIELDATPRAGAAPVVVEKKRFASDCRSRRRRVEREASAHDRLRPLELLEAHVDAGVAQLQQRAVEPFARQQLPHVVRGAPRMVEQRAIGLRGLA